jgi:MinD-like ATPase involved in chromosome partitioning or flagellar assembly
MAERVVVLIVASGAAWEPEALRLLGDHPRIVVLKRCVDVDDLLAAATAGQADVAVVGLDAPGLDRAAVDHLRAHAVRPIAIAAGGATLDGGRLRAGRIGIPVVVTDDHLHALADAICTDAGPPTVVRRPVDPAPLGPPGPRHHVVAGRVVAVWGPAGSGRTTLASALGAEIARRRRRVVLVDADPYGGAVAQQLGILDEVSGLLAAVRLDGAGQLEQRLGSVQRGLDQHLSVVTGLPRADRWVEIRAGAVEHLLSLLSAGAEVVVDTGFSIEEDPFPDLGGRPGRNQMTVDALDAADDVLVVGAADPVGLSRLARAVVELRERRSGRPVQVVVNRMRPSLGWSEREIVAMVSEFARPSAVHFLPDDQATVDRALVQGRTLVEVGDSDLGRAVSRLTDALVPEVGAQAAKSR